MQLTEHQAGDHYHITELTEDRVWLSRQASKVQLSRSFIVGAHVLIEDWPVHELDALQRQDESLLAPLIQASPELVVLGCGAAQALPNPTLMAWFHQRNIGLELMSLDAAARTFNVLMSEQRRALGAFVLPALISPT